MAIADPWDFESMDLEARLRDRVLREGRRRGPEWIDYFVLTRGLYGADLPPFVVGRVFLGQLASVEGSRFESSRD